MLPLGTLPQCKWRRMKFYSIANILQPVVLTQDPYHQQTSGAVYRDCQPQTFERGGNETTYLLRLELFL